VIAKLGQSIWSGRDISKILLGKIVQRGVSAGASVT